MLPNPWLNCFLFQACFGIVKTMSELPRLFPNFRTQVLGSNIRRQWIIRVHRLHRATSVVWKLESLPNIYPVPFDSRFQFDHNHLIPFSTLLMEIFNTKAEMGLRGNCLSTVSNTRGPLLLNVLKGWNIYQCKYK